MFESFSPSERVEIGCPGGCYNHQTAGETMLKRNFISLHLSQTCPCSEWHVSVSFTVSWILPKMKEAAVSFMLWCCLHATHNFTNLHCIPQQSAWSQGHSPWKSAGFVFLIMILMLLSLVSKDFLFLFSCLRSIRQQCSSLACSLAICQPSLKQNCDQIYFWQQGIFWPILLPAECLESFKLMATSEEKRKSKSHYSLRKRPISLNISVFSTCFGWENILKCYKHQEFPSHFTVCMWIQLTGHFYVKALSFSD